MRDGPPAHKVRSCDPFLKRERVREIICTLECGWPLPQLTMDYTYFHSGLVQMTINLAWDCDNNSLVRSCRRGFYKHYPPSLSATNARTYIYISDKKYIKRTVHVFAATHLHVVRKYELGLILENKLQEPRNLRQFILYRMHFLGYNIFLNVLYFKVFIKKA